MSAGPRAVSLALAACLGSALACSAEPARDDARAVSSRPQKHVHKDLSPAAPRRASARPRARVRPEDRVTPRQPLEDPSGRALASFYAALARTDAGEPGALTRVAHFGDSSIGADGLTHAIRRRMQTRFGDGGAGFVNLYSATSGTRSRVVEREGAGAWTSCAITRGCRRDGRYGLGGHIFYAGPGARARISTMTRGALGREASRLELFYAERPGGGRLALRVDGGEEEIIDTDGPQLADRWRALRVPAGAHALELEARGPGDVRAYGVALETDGPGVVWDAMSMSGAFAKRLLLFNTAHIAAQLQRRDPDLVVFNFGGNDLRRVARGEVSGAGLRAELFEAYSRVMVGKPGVACIVVGVIDHGRSGNMSIETAQVELVTRAQREAARARGCAFFDSAEAMGGPRSIYAWREANPPLAAPDLKHLNRRGWDEMGRMMYEALLSGYVAYLERGAGENREEGL